MQKLKNLKKKLSKSNEMLLMTRDNTLLNYIVDKYSKGVDKDENEFFVPDYQREFVWDKGTTI